MRKFFEIIISFILSFTVAYFLVNYVALPVLEQYERLNHMIQRFPYTDEVLTVFAGLAIWLFFIQWQAKKLSVIYLYLFYSVYLFLLFVVLFTKAPTYHTFSFDPFDFIVWDQKTLTEAAMNVAYFIPLGALYGLKANKVQFTVIALLTILGIETMQYVFYIGTFAISDIILNFCGCVIGYWASFEMQRRFNY